MKGILDLLRAGLNVSYSDADTWWKKLLSPASFPGSHFAISSYHGYQGVGEQQADWVWDAPGCSNCGGSYVNFGVLFAVSDAATVRFFEHLWVKLNLWLSTYGLN